MAITRVASKQQLEITDILDFKGFQGKNLAIPTEDYHIATKGYVDSAVQGLDIKQSVRAATTANITLSGTQTIDGVALIAGNRVLVKNQTTASANGIYVVSAGAWTRAEDADTSDKVSAGLYTFVSEGTTNGNSGWVVTSDDTITLGTSDVIFTQFSGAGTYLNGDGLNLTGNTFSVKGTTNRISVSSSGVDIAATYVGQTSITTLGTIGTGTWQGTAIGVQYGGTGSNLSVTGGAGQVLKQTSVGGAITVGTLAASDIASGAALTEVDDTNVTITLGGTPATALLKAVSITAGWTGQLAVGRGGTGLATITANGVMYGNGTGNVQVTAQGGANTVLTANSGAPSFSSTPTVSTINTVGQIGVAVKPFGTSAGNTGEIRLYELAANGSDYVGFKAPDALATSANLVFTLPSTDGTGNTKYLATNGSKVLSFVQIASSEINNTTFVTSVSGTTNRITIGGTALAPTVDISTSYVGQATITTLGTIATGTWNATTIAVNKGGTGQTTYTNGELLIGNSTGNTLTKATLTGGTGITVTNGAGSITISADGADVVLKTKYAVREVPTGTINGSNAAFVVNGGAAIVAGSEMVFVNGVLMDEGGTDDYTINSGTGTITFNAGAVPQTGDKVLVTYIKS